VGKGVAAAVAAAVAAVLDGTFSTARESPSIGVPPQSAANTRGGVNVGENSAAPHNEEFTLSGDGVSTSQDEDLDRSLRN